ncbi:MAG TPA: tRNA (adenosine(37)-N6)-dimethylallyltransferase MiaA [Bryobacteraceae bacterium]|nr:tRNA (adenosine(37)-N6)-dimethylallyltransferase MiaA [Bryobacteraceae bacterium]
MEDRKVIAILGPTGSGKSELALSVAARFAGEVVNCDSLQVYRYFDVGTAKLPPEARQGITHHLIDILDPDQVFTAGDYARLGRIVLDEISTRGHLPVVAGGTGFYLRALIDGLAPGPQRDQALRDRLAARERRKSGSLHRLLRRFDPEAAGRIHPRDLPKITRALEVCLVTRRPVTELFEHGRDALGGYGILKIGLSPPREQLYEKLDRRTRQMFETGLIEEVRGILSRGFAAAVKPFESHGYRQAVQFLNGELKLDEAVFYAQRNTRHYAKRQMTWFRQEPGMEWFSGFGGDTQIQQAVGDRVSEFLALSHN